MLPIKILAGLLASALLTGCQPSPETEETAGSQPPASTATASVQLPSPSLVLPGQNEPRQLRIYLPPGYAGSDKRYPVLYLQDGQNLFDEATAFAGEWQVDETLDRLAAEQGTELIVVGIDHGGEARIDELTPWPHPEYGGGEGDVYLEFLVQQVKPYIDSHYRTLAGPDDTAIGGSSLGGLMAHYGIHRHPEIFGKAMILSPSFWFSDQVYPFTKAQPLPEGHRLYFAVGAEEDQEMLGGLEGMLLQLQPKSGNGSQAAEPNLAFSARMVPGARHNEAFWREEFPRAVRHLFGRD